MAGEHILIVDDEPAIRSTLRDVLEDEGYRVSAVRGGADALRFFADELPDLTFLDIWMDRKDGLETLAEIKRSRPEAVVVMISGHGTIETAVKATRLGAYDFVEKPLSLEKILVTVNRALEHARLERENASLRASLDQRAEIIGESAAIRALVEQIATAAPTNGRVLIHGENGSGKELVARTIHLRSVRNGRPFVDVNCAAIPEDLIESELFGHEKGAFTGALARRHGKFELADGGTLFLDEIGDMSLSAQAKVLRVLQEGVIARVGSGKLLPVDVRVIAATNKDLEREIAEGRFREDLLYRINVVPIEVPPLRERRADIPQLVQHFVDELTKRTGLPAKAFDDGALQRLSAYDWPGNIRELRNAVERLLILGSGSSVTEQDVEQLVARGPGGGGGDRGRAGTGSGGSVAGDAWLRANTFEEFKQAAERAYLLGKLKEHDWNVSETARTLEMPRSNLYKKIERYRLAREA